MKQIFLFLIVLVSYSAGFAQTIPIPVNYTIVDSVAGDLDKDGVDELVVAYNTGKEDEEKIESVPRQLIIYKNRN